MTQPSLFDTPAAPAPASPPPAARPRPTTPPRQAGVVDPSRQAFDTLTPLQLDTLAFATALSWGTDVDFVMDRLTRVSQPHARALQTLLDTGHVQQMACGWLRICPAPKLPPTPSFIEICNGVALACRAEQAALDTRHPPFKKYGYWHHQHPWHVLERLAADLEAAVPFNTKP